jgi:single-strand DNA-binding protein
MANLNKVLLIGRLTRDPEVRTFANGGKVAKFGFAVNNKRRNQQTGQWEDEAVFVEVDVFNRGEQGRQADLVEQSLHKGSQIFIEGHLRFEQWTSQDGQKRSQLKVRCDNFQFLEPRADTGEGASRFPREGSTARRPASAPRVANESAETLPDHEAYEGAEPAPGGDDIPF